jgi:hypothetical protein
MNSHSDTLRAGSVGPIRQARTGTSSKAFYVRTFSLRSPSMRSTSPPSPACGHDLAHPMNSTGQNPLAASVVSAVSEAEKASVNLLSIDPTMSVNRAASLMESIQPQDSYHTRLLQEMLQQVTRWFTL